MIISCSAISTKPVSSQPSYYDRQLDVYSIIVIVIVMNTELMM